MFSFFHLFLPLLRLHPDWFVVLVVAAQPELPLVGAGQDLFVERLRGLVLALLEVRGGQVVLGLGDVGVVRAQLLFVDF